MSDTRSIIRFKIILLGESSVGKTCMLRSLMGEQFTTDILPTIGIDFKRKKYTVHGNDLELEIWDSAGQEKFRSLTSFHMRNVRGIILVYDITRRETLERLKNYWLSSSYQQIDDEIVPMFIVGNKSDLTEQRQVTSEEAEQMLNSTPLYGFYETSSKLGTNVQELFSAVAMVMASVWKEMLSKAGTETMPGSRRESIQLKKSDFSSGAGASNGNSAENSTVKFKKCCTD